jgi:signal peptidase I
LEVQKTAANIKAKSTFREYTEAIAIAILLALFIRTFIIQAFKIPSGSMKPTLIVGDHLLVNKFIYGIRIPIVDRFLIQFKKPKRGDILVFKWPKDESKDFIKRVIGIEGDVIEIRNDILYINGQKVVTEFVSKYNDNDISEADRCEEYLEDNKHYILDQYVKYEDFGPVTVPENSVFVMGDNRDNSQDSRYWGFVTLNKIKGKALIIYWSWPSWKRWLNIIR